MAWTRDEMCARAAQELEDGFYVNLGIGMPTKVANFIPDDMDVNFQSENGMLGMGPFPTDNEVDADLINAGKQTITETPKSVYFDSAQSFAKDGSAKLLKECDLPLTGAGVVNEIITELGVFKIGPAGVHIQELAPDVTVDEVRDRSEATIVTQ